jgi:hypothetical protein
MDLVKLNQFPVVPATGIATLVSDELRGMAVHAIIFELGGTSFTKAMIDEISIGQNGKEFCPDLTGAQLQDLNEYSGMSTDNAYLPFYFGDPTARTIRGQHLGDLDMSIYQQALELKLKITGATAPTLQAYALVSPPKLRMGLGYTNAEAATVRALIRTVIQPNAAVTRKSYGVGLGSEAGAKIRSVGFFHANLTSVEFKKQGLVKHDDVSIALNSFVQGEYARVPQAGLYMLDRIVDGNQGESETTLKDDGSAWNLQVNLTVSAGDTITAYADVHTFPPLM